ncbi:hypothetical protein BC629DRAFT_1733772 [Irpex lacteus]|nr:hypothetical protein BC629DRAFT_1733772 [Irpex lacteus]
MVSFDRRNVVRLLNSAYLRITLSRVTTTFFLLSFIFFIAQVLIQAFLWTDDNSAFNNINAMVENAGVPSSLLPWLDIKKEHYNLKICSEAPYGAKNVSQVCPTVYDTNVGADSDWVLPQSFRANATIANVSQLEHVQLADGGVTLTLTEQCLYSLTYPTQRLRNSMNEELALLFSQFWLLGLSSAAVLSRSVSHVIAVFAMRVFSSAWSAYTLWRTKDLEHRLHRLITDSNTPCHSDFGVFPNYINMRIGLQIPDLILNLCALLFTGLLGLSLIKTSVRTCSTVSARRQDRAPVSLHVDRRRLRAVVVIPVDCFNFSRLKEGIISKAKLLPLDITLFVLSVILTITMVTLGYYSTRFERKRLMIAFLTLLVCFIIGFLAMFTLPRSNSRGSNGRSLPVSPASTPPSSYAAPPSPPFAESISERACPIIVLSSEDFEPDEFSTGDEAKAASARRLSFMLQTATVSTNPLVTRNTNWDFADQTRPPIYTVETLGR